MNPPLINRVANSSLEVINLENYFPTATLTHFDIKDYLFRELLLREKDFRTALKAHDWTQYEGTTLLVYCSSDAIIPVWAYMLIVTYASPYTQTVFQGQETAYYRSAFTQQLATEDWSKYENKPVVIKGCGDKPVPPAAYMELTRLLQPIARSIMYGEPCSTVPVFKKRKTL